MSSHNSPNGNLKQDVPYLRDRPHQSDKRAKMKMKTTKDL
jgi:hypothetical protein